VGIRVRFTPNRRGIAEIGRSPEMQAEMGRRAERIKGVAQGIAPVDTGLYRDTMTAFSGIGPTGKAYGCCQANTHYSVFLEFGTSKMAPFRTLGTALGVAGAG